MLDLNDEKVREKYNIKSYDVDEKKKSRKKIFNNIKRVTAIVIRYAIIISFAIFALKDAPNYEYTIPTLYYVLTVFGIIMIGVSIFGIFENFGLLKKIFPKSNFNKF